jgi:hypothetical protein
LKSSDFDTDFALSKVLKRLLSYAILLHEFLRLSYVLLIRSVEKISSKWQEVLTLNILNISVGG